MALYANLVFYPATEGTLYALDARSGNIVWKTRPTEFPDDKIGGIMVAKDKLLVGITRCNELDARDHCFIAGYEANTGKLLWKFYTVARKGMPGGDTWGKLPNLLRAGGDTWITGSYDPDLNETYWGVAQAKPWMRVSLAPSMRRICPP